MDDSDAGALVKAALQNDDDATRALVRRLYPLVARIVRAHRLRRTSEEDLCQMIFIKVFQKLWQFSGNVPLTKNSSHALTLSGAHQISFDLRAASGWSWSIG